MPFQWWYRFDREPSATVTPAVVSVSIPTVTATYVYERTATVAPVVVAVTLPAVTAQKAAMLPVVVSVSIPAVTATYVYERTATVAPLAVAVSAPAVTATSVAEWTAAVAPLVVNVAVPAVTATPQFAHLDWAILFDWAGDGGYATDEAAKVTALRIERGRSDPFAPFDAGKAVLTLDNEDRRLDPWYAASPLYPNVLPRRGVKISVTTAGTTYALFAGRIEELEPTGRKGQRQVTITAYDGLRDLAQVDVPTIGVTTATEAGAAIALALTAAGWPAGAGARDLDTSADTMAYWWTWPGAKAKAVCDDLAASEYGAFFISGAGKATFVNRANYISGAAAGTLDQSQLVDIRLSAPWEQICNLLVMTAYPIAVQVSADLWQLQDTPVIAAGESLTLWGHYQDSYTQPCAATTVLDPVATTDYTANAQADGLGADMTANLTVTATKYGTEAKFVLANGHATDDLYVTLLKIRGDALARTPVALREEDAGSQATYGKRVLALDMPHQQDVATAAGLAENLIALLADPAPVVTVALEHLLPDVFKYELLDTITFTSTEYSIGADFRLERLALATGATMQYITAEFLLQPTRIDVSPWLLGTAGRGELGIKTYAGW